MKEISLVKKDNKIFIFKKLFELQKWQIDALEKIISFINIKDAQTSFSSLSIVFDDVDMVFKDKLIFECPRNSGKTFLLQMVLLNTANTILICKTEEERRNILNNLKKEDILLECDRVITKNDFLNSEFTEDTICLFDEIKPEELNRIPKKSVFMLTPIYSNEKFIYGLEWFDNMNPILESFTDKARVNRHMGHIKRFNND